MCSQIGATSNYLTALGKPPSLLSDTGEVQRAVVYVAGWHLRQTRPPAPGCRHCCRRLVHSQHRTLQGGQDQKVGWHTRCLPTGSVCIHEPGSKDAVPHARDLQVENVQVQAASLTPLSIHDQVTADMAS